MRERERVRESVCVCVCVYVRERERGDMILRGLVIFASVGLKG